jgi:hypothetical protein
VSGFNTCLGGFNSLAGVEFHRASAGEGKRLAGNWETWGSPSGLGTKQMRQVSSARNLVWTLPWTELWTQVSRPVSTATQPTNRK